MKYNQIKQNDDCNSGAKIADAIAFLRENGDCLARNFDHEINDCSKKPTPSLEKEAGNYTVTDFMTLFGTEDAPDIKKLKILKYLFNLYRFNLFF